MVKQEMMNCILEMTGHIIREKKKLEVCDCWKILMTSPVYLSCYGSFVIEIPAFRCLIQSRSYCNHFASIVQSWIVSHVSHFLCIDQSLLAFHRLLELQYAPMFLYEDILFFLFILFFIRVYNSLQRIHRKSSFSTATAHFSRKYLRNSLVL